MQCVKQCVKLERWGIVRNFRAICADECVHMLLAYYHVRHISSAYGSLVRFRFEGDCHRGAHNCKGMRTCCIFKRLWCSPPKSSLSVRYAEICTRLAFSYPKWSNIFRHSVRKLYTRVATNCAAAWCRRTANGERRMMTLRLNVCVRECVCRSLCVRFGCRCQRRRHFITR